MEVPPGMLTTRESGLDPLRQTIRSGKSLIAGIFMDDGLEQAIRHAAFLCGRERDVRTVYLEAPFNTLAGLGRDARRFDASILPNEGVRSGMFALDAKTSGAHPECTNESFGDSITAFAHLEPFVLSDATDGKCLVIFVGGKPSCVEILVRWIVERAVMEARGRGEQPPIVFLDGHDPQPYSSAPGWTHRRKNGLDICCPDAIVDKTFELATSDRLAWQETSERCRAAIPMTLSGDNVAIASEDRMVLLISSPVPPGETAEEGIILVNVAIYEVDANGWTTGLRFNSLCAANEEAATETLREIARAVWSSGIKTLVVRNGGWEWTVYRHAKRTEGPIHLYLARLDSNHPFMTLPNVAGIMAKADDAVDKALVRKHDPQALTALIQGHPRRREFLLTWPILSGLLLIPEIRARIDAREEMTPALMRHLGASRSTVRRLVGRLLGPKLCEVLKEHQTYGRYPLGSFLDGFGHGALPRRGDEAEWIAFVSLLDLVFPIYGSGRIRRAPADVPRGLVMTIPGRTWQDRLRSTGSLDPRTVQDIGDVILSLSRWLTSIGHEAPDPNGTALTLLARGRSLLQLRDASILWHADARLVASGGRIPSDATWPVPFGAIDLGDGWKALPIASTAGLRSEGMDGTDPDGVAGLAHCVESYAEACFLGSSLILSVTIGTLPQSRRDSTVELVLDPMGDWSIGGIGYRLRQHRGLRNATPSAEALARVESLRKMFADDVIPIDRAAMEPRKIPSTGSGPTWDRRPLWEAWRRIMPDRFAGMTVDAMLAEAASIAEIMGVARDA